MAFLPGLFGDKGFFGMHGWLSNQFASPGYDSEITVGGKMSDQEKAQYEKAFGPNFFGPKAPGPDPVMPPWTPNIDPGGPQQMYKNPMGLGAYNTPLGRGPMQPSFNPTEQLLMQLLAGRRY